MRFYLMITVLLASTQAHAQDFHAEEFDCVMDPAELVEVGSPVSGLLDEVLVRRGDWVEKGQLVARLNTDIEQASLELLAARAESTAALEAQIARRDLVNTRFERTKELLEKNIASVDQMDEVSAELVASDSLVQQAELDRNLAQKELIRARVSVSQRTIHSPIDGIVVSRSRTGGEFLDQGNPVISIVKLDPLHVEAFLPVEFYAEVKEGRIAEVVPAAPVEGQYAAKVTVVDRVFDAASSTFGVRLELANPDGNLPAGHRCKLTFPSNG